MRCRGSGVLDRRDIDLKWRTSKNEGDCYSERRQGTGQCKLNAVNPPERSQDSQPSLRKQLLYYDKYFQLSLQFGSDRVRL